MHLQGETFVMRTFKCICFDQDKTAININNTETEFQSQCY